MSFEQVVAQVLVPGAVILLLAAVVHRLTRLQSTLLDAARTARAPVGAGVSSDPQWQPEPSLEPLTVGRTLLLGEADEPLVQLSLVDPRERKRSGSRPSGGSTPGGSSRSGAGPAARERVGHLLDQVLGESSKSLMTTAGTYRLVFSPEVQSRLASGTAETIGGGGMMRAFVRDPETKKFIEHGNLVRAGASPAALATLAWQAAAVVTAQRFLVAIDRKMADLNSKLDSVMQWLEDEERGLLLGNYRYLQTIHTALRGEACSRQDLLSFVPQFESIDRECLKVQCAALLRLQASLRNLHALHADKEVGWKEAVGYATAITSDARRDVQALFLALRLRALATWLAAELPVSRGLLVNRLQEAWADLSGARIACANLLEALNKPKEEFNHLFNTGKAKEEHRKAVLGLLAQVNNEYHSMLQATEDHLQSLESNLQARLEAAAQPLVLEVDCAAGGRVLEARCSSAST